jgi:flavin-dependent dehydrogenase
LRGVPFGAEPAHSGKARYSALLVGREAGSKPPLLCGPGTPLGGVSTPAGPVAPRNVLDWKLASLFVAEGGELHTASRLPMEDQEGRVIATGRRKTKSLWLGLKIHLSKTVISSDLELHVGEGAYAGLALLPDGRVNLCALFRSLPRTESGDPVERFAKALDRAHLSQVAERLWDGGPVRESLVGVSHFAFGNPEGSLAAIGDAFAVIPPFTGHGMAMALESAFWAVEPMERYAKGQLDWGKLKRELLGRLRHAFGPRLLFAKTAHRVFLSHRLFRSVAVAWKRWPKLFPWLYHRVAGCPL